MARTRGQNKGVITWHRPRYEFGLDGDSARRTGTGLYADCLSSRPRVGQTMAGVRKTFKVSKVIVEPGESIDAIITVEFVGRQDGNSDTVEEPIPIYEKDDCEATKPIESHHRMIRLSKGRPYYQYPEYPREAQNNPSYPSLSVVPNDPDTDKPFLVAQRTIENWDVLEEDDLAASAGGWTADDYRTLKEAGEDSFSLSFPIARATTYHAERPDPSTVLWVIDSPPSECGAPTNGWFYLKTKDTVIKEGPRYRRIQEWAGHRETEPASLLYA